MDIDDIFKFVLHPPPTPQRARKILRASKNNRKLISYHYTFNKLFGEGGIFPKKVHKSPKELNYARPLCEN
jgi:hypothetical protein